MRRWLPTAPGRPMFSCTSSATTWPALADEYYTSDVAYLPATDGRSRGSRTRPPCWTRRPEVEGPRQAGTRCRRRGRKTRTRAYRAATRSDAGRFGLRIGLKPRWTRCSAKRWCVTPTSSAAAARGHRRCLRGRQLRGKGLLSAAVGLHHVHPGRSAVLRCLPPRHRDDSRPLRAWIAS